MSERLARCIWPALPERYAVALRDAVAFALSETDPVGVVAAGTVVRGAPHPSSDLDLYVIHEAPLRRRVQRYFGDPALGEPVPAEIFINPPAAVRRYFADEHADGRPFTAHMLATGFTVFAEGPDLDALRSEAAGWLARPSVPTAAEAVRTRYAAATRLEDASDVAADDPETAVMLAGLAVFAMLEFSCQTSLGAVPRGKDLIARVASLDPVLGDLARRVFSDAPAVVRLEAAAQVADRTVGVRGFFEWDSGPEPA